MEGLACEMHSMTTVGQVENASQLRLSGEELDSNIRHKRDRDGGGH